MITVSELKFNFNALATENLYLAVDKILTWVLQGGNPLYAAVKCLSGN